MTASSSGTERVSAALHERGVPAPVTTAGGQPNERRRPRSSYDLVVIGGGPAGLAAASLAARAGVATVLFDENPGVGGQIYRGITSTPVTNRAILGEDYWAGEALASEAKASGALIVNGATVWSLDPERVVGVSIAGKARLIEARRVIIATGSQERPFPIPGWTLPGVMTAGAAQTVLKAQGLLPDGRTVMAGTGPLLWLLAAQILRAGGKIAAILDTTPRRNCCARPPHLPDFMLSPYFAKGLALLREVKAKVPVRRVTSVAAVGDGKLSEVVSDARRACRPISCCCTRASCPTSISPSLSARRMNGTSVSSASSPCSTRISAARCPASPWPATARASPAARRRPSADASRPSPRCARSSPTRRAARSAERAPAPAARGDGPRLPRLAVPSGRLASASPRATRSSAAARR